MVGKGQQRSGKTISDPRQEARYCHQSTSNPRLLGGGIENGDGPFALGGWMRLRPPEEQVQERLVGGESRNGRQAERLNIVTIACAVLGSPSSLSTCELRPPIDRANFGLGPWTPHPEGQAPTNGAQGSYLALFPDVGGDG
ncbi:hypothetical protein RJ55_06258 [Drechmeria coniospora]|nr:hypothetical protein RJ55_06258 [Drechmeria coniospora]